MHGLSISYNKGAHFAYLAFPFKKVRFFNECRSVISSTNSLLVYRQIANTNQLSLYCIGFNSRCVFVCGVGGEGGVGGGGWLSWG